MPTVAGSARRINTTKRTQRRWFGSYAGADGVVREQTHDTVLFTATGLTYSLVVPVRYTALGLPAAEGLQLSGPPLHGQRGQAGGHRGCRARR